MRKEHDVTVNDVFTNALTTSEWSEITILINAQVNNNHQTSASFLLFMRHQLNHILTRLLKQPSLECLEVNSSHWYVTVCVFGSSLYQELLRFAESAIIIMYVNFNNTHTVNQKKHPHICTYLSSTLICDPQVAKLLVIAS